LAADPSEARSLNQEYTSPGGAVPAGDRLHEAERSRAVRSQGAELQLRPQRLISNGYQRTGQLFLASALASGSVVVADPLLAFEDHNVPFDHLLGFTRI
jgi:hypothetical protein